MNNLPAWPWASAVILVTVWLVASPVRADEPTVDEPTYAPDAWFPSEATPGATDPAPPGRGTAARGPRSPNNAAGEAPAAGTPGAGDTGGPEAGPVRRDPASEGPAAAAARSHDAYAPTRRRREPRHGQPLQEVDGPVRAGGITLVALGGASLLGATLIALAPSGPFSAQSHSNETVRAAFLLGGAGVVLGGAGVVVLQHSTKPRRSVAVGVGAGSLHVDGSF